MPSRDPTTAMAICTSVTDSSLEGDDFSDAGSLVDENCVTGTPLSDEEEEDMGIEDSTVEEPNDEDGDAGREDSAIDGSDKKKQK